MCKRPEWKSCLFVALLLTITPLLSAQATKDKIEKSPGTFKTRTELVLVPAVVLKGDKAVHGLTKDNFIVEQDGKARALTVFEAVEPQTKKVVKKSTSGEFTNVGSDNIPRAMTLIVIDAINTAQGYQEQSRKDILKYLAKNIVPNQLVGVVLMTPKGVKIIHDFTSNTDILMAALSKVTGENNVRNRDTASYAPQPEVTKIAETAPNPLAASIAAADDSGTPVDMAAQQMAVTIRQMQDFIRGVDLSQSYITQANVQTTLEYFQQIAQGLSGYPGRKTLVWTSASFPTPFDPTRYNNTALASIYERTLKLLSDANVVVYPVDIRGLNTNPGADATLDPYQRAAGVDPSMAYREAQSKIDSFRDFADRTGGRSYFDINKVSEALEDIAAESQTYYMLGYYLDSSEKQGWHKLKVKLNNVDGKVHARDGFFITPATNDPEVSRKSDLAVASRSPFDYTTLQLTGKFSGTTGTGPKKKVEFVIRVLPSNTVIDADNANTINLDFVAVARKADTTVGGQASRNITTKLPPEAVTQIKNDGISYKGAMDLEPGDYEVRFLVRDNITGRMGSLLAPLQVK
jgi:VWFA-related protein